MSMSQDNIRDSLSKLRSKGQDSDEEFEELLKQQEEFLKNKPKPSASVIRTKSTNTTTASNEINAPVEKTASVAETKTAEEVVKDPWDMVIDASKNTYEIPKAAAPYINQNNINAPEKPKKKLSLFAQSRLAQRKNQQNNTSDHSKANDQKESSNDPSPTSSSSSSSVLVKLMKDIPEHNPSKDSIKFPQVRQESGFPITAELLLNNNSRSSNSGEDDAQINGNDSQSIQAQLAQSLKSTTPSSGSDWISETKRQANESNTQKLASMSSEDIEQAREEIKEFLSDSALASLMARLNSKTTKPTQSDVQKQDRHMESKEKSVHFASAVEVKENEEEDDDDDMPPPLEPIDQEETENTNSNDSTADEKKKHDDAFNDRDSQFYKDLKEMYYPDEPLEEKKLEWILNQQQARSPAKRAMDTIKAQTNRAVNNMRSVMNGEEPDILDEPASHIRFGFDGNIIESVQSDIPVSKGLHHHGEDPDEAGYTIPELLHLCRSKVPAQRSLPLRILGNILHMVNVGGYDLPIAKAIYRCWLVDWEGHLYFQDAWKDRNVTVIMVAVMATWTWVVEMAHYSVLVDVLGDKPNDMDDRDTAAQPPPGVNVKTSDNPSEPRVAEGELVEQTFKAYEGLIKDAILTMGPEIIFNELIPKDECRLIVEIVKVLSDMSSDFKALLNDPEQSNSQKLQDAIDYLV